jgi:hypothetical protein
MARIRSAIGLEQYRDKNVINQLELLKMKYIITVSTNKE